MDLATLVLDSTIALKADEVADGLAGDDATRVAGDDATRDPATSAFTCGVCRRVFQKETHLGRHIIGVDRCRTSVQLAAQAQRAKCTKRARSSVGVTRSVALRRVASINTNQGGVLCLRGAAPAELLCMMDRIMTECTLDGTRPDGVVGSDTLEEWLELEDRATRFRIPLGVQTDVVALLKEWLEASLKGGVEPILRSLPHAPELPQLVDIAASDADDINLILGRSCVRESCQAVSSHGSLPLHRDLDVADLPRGACTIAVIVLLCDIDDDTGFTRVFANSRGVVARRAGCTNKISWDPRVQTQRARHVLSNGDHVVVDCKGKRGDVFMFDACNLHEVIGAGVRDDGAASRSRRVLLFDIWTCAMMEQSTRWTTDRACVLTIRPPPIHAQDAASSDAPNRVQDAAASGAPTHAQDAAASDAECVPDAQRIPDAECAPLPATSVGDVPRAVAQHRRQQVSLAHAQQENVAILKQTWPTMTCKERAKWREVKSTMVRSEQFDQDACETLEAFLRQHWPEGATCLVHPDLPIRITGFGSYARTLVDHDAKLQAQQTLYATRARPHQWHCQLQWLRKLAPGFLVLENAVIKWLNSNFSVTCNLAGCQILKQTRQSCASTTFDLHQDTEDDDRYPNVRYSAIIKLSAQHLWEPASQMKVAGTTHNFAYGASRGATAIFLGELYHQGLPHVSSNPCLKLAFHFSPMSDAERRMRRGEPSL